MIHFGKRTVRLLIYYLNYASFDIQPSLLTYETPSTILSVCLGMSKKKKSKKKLSKEEDETTRSEVNLLTASTDPNLKVDTDDETTHNDELPAKPDMPSMSVPEAEVNEEKPVSNKRSSVSSKKKSYRKGSDSSIRHSIYIRTVSS